MKSVIPILVISIICLLSVQPLSFAMGIPIQLNNSQFISQNIPDTLIAGKVYDVSITFKNSGKLPWLPASSFKLIPIYNLWNVGKIPMSNKDIILPGQTKKFVFQITAPQIPGNYNFEWQMKKDGLGLFGERSKLVSIKVSEELSLLPIGNKSVFEDQVLNFTVAAKGSNVKLSASQLPSGASFDSSTGSFNWKPEHGQAGSYPMTFEATDGINVKSENIITNVQKTVIYGTIYEKTLTNETIQSQGASVEIWNLQRTQVLASAVSGANGHFDVLVDTWLDGTYIIKASKANFKSYSGVATLRNNSMMPFMATLTIDAPLGIKNYPIEGVIFASWWNGEYQWASSGQSLINLAKTGAEWVGLLGSWYMDGGEYSTSNVIYSHATKTPSDADLIHAIVAAKSLGRKVMLKLHIRTIVSESPWSDKWAGYINPSDKNVWFNNYIQFVNHYADLCQANGVDILCFGTELPSMTSTTYNAKWIDVINNIRSRYTGKITFSSNIPNEYDNITFWNLCDYLGIGPYLSTTTNIANPGLDTLVDGWYNSPVDGKIVDKLAQWSSKNGNKQIIFTEMGYCSVNTSSYCPWKGTSDLNGVPLAENWVLQKRCYDAMFMALQNKPWFFGVFVWDWLCDPIAGTTGLNRKEYTPQNKDAENSMKNFYLGINMADIHHIIIVDGNDVEIPNGTTVYIQHTKNLFARAYNSSGQIIGYAPCTWDIDNSNGTIAGGNVGYTRVTGISEGQSTVTATTSNGYYDTVTFNIAKRYLRVPLEYSTIQSAVNAAIGGDTVLVSPGIYTGSIDLKLNVNLKSVGGASLTTINGGIILANGQNNNIIEGFTVTNTSGTGISGSSSGTPTIKNNIIKNNGWIGIYMYSSSPLILNNIIEGNVGGINGNGGNPRIINNVIKNNSGISQGGGIYYVNSSAKIFNNIIVNNYASQYGGGVKGWNNGAGYEVDYNNIWNNTAGLGQPEYGDCNPGPNSLSTNPLFSDANYHLQSTSPCKNTGNPLAEYNDIDSTRNDMGVYGGPNSF